MMRFSALSPSRGKILPFSPALTPAFGLHFFVYLPSPSDFVFVPSHALPLKLLTKHIIWLPICLSPMMITGSRPS
jgi:hypothetical protein